MIIKIKIHLQVHINALLEMDSTDKAKSNVHRHLIYNHYNFKYFVLSV